MCGRLTLKTAPDQWGQLLLPLVDQLHLPGDFAPRYNIAPTQLLVGLTSEGSQRRLRNLRWGLIPSWASELSIGSSLINARRETLLEKRSFKGLMGKHRCLVVVDGYYEWHRLTAKTKQTYWITPSEDSLMLLAGLWDNNPKASGQSIDSCTLITTAANSAMSSIHDRMPMPLVGQAAQLWLDPGYKTEQAVELLTAVDESFFKTQAVSSYVNNVRNQGPECIAAV